MKPRLFLYSIALIACTLQADAQTRKIKTFAGSGGTGGYGGDGYAATGAVMNGPSTVSAARDGSVYIVDYYNFRVRRVKTNGTIVTFAGTGVTGAYTDSNIATTENIWPLGVAADSKGNVFISEPSRQKIYKVKTNGIMVRFAGIDTPGYSGDGGNAKYAKLKLPFGLTVDRKDNLYIADAGNHVIRKITPAGIISTVAGNNMAGFSGDGGAATAASLDSPYAMAVNKYGDLFIADKGNNVIRKVDTNGYISTIAGTGAVGYTGDGNLAISATMRYPSGVVADTLGNVYFSDTYNNAIRMIDRFGFISTLAGNGTPGFGGDLAAPEGASLFTPYGLSIDSLGTIYIADANNQRVRRIYYPTVGVTEVTDNNSISVYPNPAGNTITVAGAQANQKIVIIDAYGRLVSDIKETTNSQSVSFGISSLAAGTYFVKVFGDNNAAAQISSFVKQ